MSLNNFEIELKAKLDNPEPVKNRLSELGEYFCYYEKYDSYWYLKDSLSGVRIRREHGLYADGMPYDSIIVNYKNKGLVGGIEVNEENEFSVSDYVVFEGMLRHIGMSIILKKEKKGYAWYISSEEDGISPILAELSLVTGLGWYLELEIMADGKSDTTVEKNRKRLLSVLEKLNISTDRIEPRSYSALLSE